MAKKKKIILFNYQTLLLQNTFKSPIEQLDLALATKQLHQGPLHFHSKTQVVMDFLTTMLPFLINQMQY